MERLNGQRLQLEQQINTLESANLNLETMQAMKTASDALEQIHGRMCVFAPSPRPLFLTMRCRKINDVDSTMTRIAEQREIANEISEAISAPIDQVDEVIHSFAQALQAFTPPIGRTQGGTS